MCIHIYKHMCICIHTYTYISIYTYKYMYIYTYIFENICACVTLCITVRVGAYGCGECMWVGVGV